VTVGRGWVLMSGRVGRVTSGRVTVGPGVDVGVEVEDVLEVGRLVDVGGDPIWVAPGMRL
jgi:hypothetical protein